MDAIHILLLVSGLAGGGIISYFVLNASMQNKKTQLLKEAQDKGFTDYYLRFYQLLSKAYAQNGQYRLALENLESFKYNTIKL